MPEVSLEFPFANVSAIDVAFGGIPNYQEVVDAVPQEFYERNPWSEAAEHIFYFGIKKEEFKQLRIRASNPQEASMKMAYLRTWIGSYDPPQEVKLAVCGWLFSLMLEKPPTFSR